MARKPKFDSPTEAECIEALKKAGHPIDAKQVAYRVLKDRPNAPDGEFIIVYDEAETFAPAVRKKLNELAEEGTIDSFDMRRPVKYAYVSPEEQKRREKQTQEREEEEETVRGILTASSFTDEEIEKIMIGSRVRMSSDQLKQVFEAGRFLGKAEAK